MGLRTPLQRRSARSRRCVAWTWRALAVAALVPAALAAGPAAADTAAAGPGATLELLVPPTVMHGIEGINFDLDGHLLGASIHGQSVYRIDVRTGRVSVAVGPPHGEADDVAVGPAGTPVAGILAWTAQVTGEIRIQRPGGVPEVAMPNVPRVNPIAFRADGRLFTAQVGAGEDSLWELDLVSGQPPRRVASGRGRLNGFGFGPDGRLYTPQFGTDRLVAIDVDRGEFTTIAQGVGSPAAVKVAPNGDVYSVDYLRGDLWLTPGTGGGSRVVAQVREPIDSLAIAPDGTIYVSNVADSSVVAIDPVRGRSRTVVHGVFSIPLGMGLASLDGVPRLIVADPFGYRFVDPKRGTVTRPPWAANRGASSAVVADERSIAFSWAGGAGRVRQIDRATDTIVVDTAAVGAPRGIALTSRGEMVVADAREGRLVRVTAQAITALATGLDEPVAVLLESDGVALVAEARAGRISRVDLADGRRTTLVEGLRRPTGLARLPDGRLVVVEPDLGQVLAIDPQSQARTILATGLRLSLDGLDLPRNTNAGVVVDGDGTVFVACAGDNSIYRIAPAGGRRTQGKSR